MMCMLYMAFIINEMADNRYHFKRLCLSSHISTLISINCSPGSVIVVDKEHGKDVALHRD